MQDKQEVAGRIADHLAMLALLAKAAKLDVLGYMIDMAGLEANQAARQR